MEPSHNGHIYKTTCSHKAEGKFRMREHYKNFKSQRTKKIAVGFLSPRDVKSYIISHEHDCANLSLARQTIIVMPKWTGKDHQVSTLHKVEQPNNKC